MAGITDLNKVFLRHWRAARSVGSGARGQTLLEFGETESFVLIFQQNVTVCENTRLIFFFKYPELLHSFIFFNFKQLFICLDFLVLSHETQLEVLSNSSREQVLKLNCVQPFHFLSCIDKP